MNCKILSSAVRLSVRYFHGVRLFPAPHSRLCVQLKEYSQWMHRRPATIINEDEIFEDVIEEPTDPKMMKKARAPIRRPENNEQKKPVDSNATLDENNDPIYTKLQPEDRLMSSLMLKIRSRKRRTKQDQIILEGKRLIKDAFEAGYIPEIIIFSRTPDLKSLPLPKEGVKLYKIPYRSIQLWSTLETSPGIMGIFKTPDVHLKEPSPEALPLTIICDNVREPGNLGTILRSAAGVGCDKVILTKGCVDLWEPKVLRSAAGAHFRIPIYKSQGWNNIETLVSQGDVFIADNNVHFNSECTVTDSSPATSEDTSSKPLEHSDSDSESDTESNSMTLTSDQDEIKPEESKSDTVPKTSFRDALPVIPYFAADYTKNEIILIVGGETEGLSNESFNLVKKHGGTRVNIPLTNGVNSLNTAMALGIVAFEVKRQFLILQKTYL